MLKTIQKMMEQIQKIKLPIKKIELLDLDKCSPYLKNYEIIVSSNNMDTYRIFWLRKPTEIEINKLKKIL